MKNWQMTYLRPPGQLLIFFIDHRYITIVGACSATHCSYQLLNAALIVKHQAGKFLLPHGIDTGEHLIGRHFAKGHH